VEVVLEIIAAGDVSSFDESAYRSSLQAMFAVQGLNPSRIVLTVRPASVLVTAAITFSGVSDANTAIATVLAMSFNRLSFHLGVSVERVLKVDLASSGAVVGTGTGPTIAQKAGERGSESDTALVVGLVVGIVIVSVISVAIGVKIYKAARAREPPKSVVVQAVNVHDVALMSATAASDGRV